VAAQLHHAAVPARARTLPARRVMLALLLLAAALAAASPPLGEGCLALGGAAAARTNQRASFSAAGRASLEFCLEGLRAAGVPSPTLARPAAAVQLHVSKPATAPCAVALTVLWRPSARASGGGAPPGGRGRPAPAAGAGSDAGTGAGAAPTVLATADEERLTLPLAALQGWEAAGGTLHVRIDFDRGSEGAYAPREPGGPALHMHVPFDVRLDTIGWGGLPDALLVGALLPLLRAALAAAALAAAAARCWPVQPKLRRASK
jgi:hypothetical protein